MSSSHDYSIHVYSCGPPRANWDQGATSGDGFKDEYHLAVSLVLCYWTIDLPGYLSGHQESVSTTHVWWRKKTVASMVWFWKTKSAVPTFCLTVNGWLHVGLTVRHYCCIVVCCMTWALLSSLFVDTVNMMVSAIGSVLGLQVLFPPLCVDVWSVTWKVYKYDYIWKKGKLFV